MSKGQANRHDDSWQRDQEDDDKEGLVAEGRRELTTEHPRHHNTEVHQTISKSIVSHLILPWSDLLHHKERDPDEPEAVAEVFEDDTRTDPPEVGGLEDSQDQVDSEGDIEDTDQREERLLQTKVRDIVAREDGAEDEGNRTCRTIDQAIVLIGECYPALSDSS